MANLKKIAVHYADNTGDKMACLFNILDLAEMKYVVKGHGVNRRVVFVTGKRDRWRLKEECGIKF